MRINVNHHQLSFLVRARGSALSAERVVVFRYSQDAGSAAGHAIGATGVASAPLFSQIGIGPCSLSPRERATVRGFTEKALSDPFGKRRKPSPSPRPSPSGRGRSCRKSNEHLNLPSRNQRHRIRVIDFTRIGANSRKSFFDLCSSGSICG